MRIFKYPVPVPDMNGFARILLPYGAKILSVGIQIDRMVLWVSIPESEVYPQKHREIWHELRVVNTGMKFDDNCLLQFIGTVVHHDSIVWHIFEEK